MNDQVKFKHLILIAISLFLLYYLWVEFGGRHGQAPVFPSGNPIPRNE